MEVYVLLRYDPDGYEEFLDVFSTMEKAIEAREEREENDEKLYGIFFSDYEYHIVKCEVK